MSEKNTRSAPISPLVLYRATGCAEWEHKKENNPHADQNTAVARSNPDVAAAKRLANETKRR